MSIRMSEYDEVYEKILLSESVDFTAKYRKEHRSSHQPAILGYVY